MQKILVSACLLGEKVRYQGGDCFSDHPVLAKWKKEGRIVPICPEVSAGLPIPRAPAEILGPGGGSGVFAKTAKVFRNDGQDLTEVFIQGAQNALRLAKLHGIRIAILKERSPSCGSQFIYTGDFSSTKIDGEGVTTALLRQSGVFVFSENQVDEAFEKLTELEN